MTFCIRGHMKEVRDLRPLSVVSRPPSPQTQAQRVALLLPTLGSAEAYSGHTSSLSRVSLVIGLAGHRISLICAHVHVGWLLFDLPF